MSIKCIKEDYEKVKAFYIDILGLKVLREWPDGVMIDVGGDILEVFNNGVDRLPQYCGRTSHELGADPLYH